MSRQQKYDIYANYMLYSHKVSKTRIKKTDEVYELYELFEMDIFWSYLHQIQHLVDTGKISFVAGAILIYKLRFPPNEPNKPKKKIDFQFIKNPLSLYEFNLSKLFRTGLMKTDKTRENEKIAFSNGAIPEKPISNNVTFNLDLQSMITKWFTVFGVISSYKKYEKFVTLNIENYELPIDLSSSHKFRLFNYIIKKFYGDKSEDLARLVKNQKPPNYGIESQETVTVIKLLDIIEKYMPVLFITLMYEMSVGTKWEWKKVAILPVYAAVTYNLETLNILPHIDHNVNWWGAMEPIPSDKIKTATGIKDKMIYSKDEKPKFWDVNDDDDDDDDDDKKDYNKHGIDTFKIPQLKKDWVKNEIRFTIKHGVIVYTLVLTPGLWWIEENGHILNNTKKPYEEVYSIIPVINNFYLTYDKSKEEFDEIKKIFPKLTEFQFCIVPFEMLYTV